MARTAAQNAARQFYRSLDTAEFAVAETAGYLFDAPVIIRRRVLSLLFILLEYWSKKYALSADLGSSGDEIDFLREANRYHRALSGMRVE